MGGAPQVNNTVQSELKLSVKLQSQIAEQKNMIDEQNEQL
jgi:hypothetical protein